MQHALTRNRTYAAVDAEGKGQRYHNIRTFKHRDHTSLMDGDEQWALPPAPAPACQDAQGTPRCYYGWQLPNSSTVDEFSAACWFTAQELTDIAAERNPNSPAPVIGLIQSAWGGTEIELWLRNDTIAECKNASGGIVDTKDGKRNNGALWNGMVAPFINYTIFGALWYQGENNVYECVDAGKRNSENDDVKACGNALDATGYACQQKSLVNGWRRQWSVVPGTTASDFPFGIVSLAAGTSEGHSNSMAAFRLAQTASYGILPGPKGSGMERTFIAQAYDAADPGDRTRSYKSGQTRTGPTSQCDAPYQSDYDAPFPGRMGCTAGGVQQFTQQYMGGLHPRAKQIVGRRLALAAAAVAYGWKDVPYTGPVLKNCSVLPAGRRCVPGSADYDACMNSQTYRYMGIAQRQITLNFDEELLGTDAVQLWPTAPDTEGLAMVTMYNCLNGTCLSACGANSSCVEQCATLKAPQCNGLAITPLGPDGNGGNPTQYNAGHMHFKTGRIVSPLEVQLNGTIWMPASFSFNAGHGGDPLHRDDCIHPERPCTNWSRADGWSSVVAQVPVAIPIGCGRGFDRNGAPQSCPPADQLRPDEWCENCTAHFLPTGVRYAWAEHPCCGGQPPSDNILPCPVNSCPISTYNSTLPAVPFSAKLVWNNETANGLGTCQCAPPMKCGGAEADEALWL